MYSLSKEGTVALFVACQWSRDQRLEERRTERRPEWRLASHGMTLRGRGKERRKRGLPLSFCVSDCEIGFRAKRRTRKKAVAEENPGYGLER
jgi:hypothetical protein